MAHKKSEVRLKCMFCGANIAPLQTVKLCPAYQKEDKNRCLSTGVLAADLLDLRKAPR